MEGGTSAMSSLVTLFTQFMTWMSELIEIVISNPLFLLPVGIFCVGAAIGLVGRLIGR